MIDLPSGSVWIEQGELVPFRCPSCGKHIPFDACVVEILCKCGYQGSVEEFCQVEYIIVPSN